MMKMLVAMTILTVALLVDGRAETRELLDAKYVGQKNLSKLTFTFSEPIRFLHKKLSANQARLTFPNTTSEKFASRVPLIFKSGHAKNLSFDFSRQDTVIVILTLNQNVQYDLRRPKGTGQIVVDMYSTEPAVHDGNEVDIAALVRKQMESVQVPQVDHPKEAREEQPFEVQTMPLTVAIFTSLLGTAVLLVRLRKPKATAQTLKALPVLPDPEPDPVETILKQARIILHEKSTKPRPKPEPIAEERVDAATHLAKQFGRGEGDLHLVEKLHSASHEYAWQKRLQSDRLGKVDTVARAKKLGVGRGELALAASIQRMRQSHEQKERRS